jgi:hypothetical protein
MGIVDKCARERDQIGIAGGYDFVGLAGNAISPTAQVGISASRLTAAANGTWYPGVAGIGTAGTAPPEETGT